MNMEEIMRLVRDLDTCERNVAYYQRQHRAAEQAECDAANQLAKEYEKHAAAQRAIVDALGIDLGRITK